MCTPEVVRKPLSPFIVGSISFFVVPCLVAFQVSTLIMLRRFTPAMMAATPVALFRSTMPQLKTNDPTYEDDRWLEAELVDKEKTPEERYAAEKQAAALKKMMSKIRTETKAHVAEVHKEKDTKVAALEETVRQLQKQIANLKK